MKKKFQPGLAKLTYLAALTSISHYGITILFGLVANPLILGWLGPYWFGIWKICQRLLTYVSSVDGQSTQALKLKIGNNQHSNDFTNKTQQVSCALSVWLKFLPLLIFSGSILAFFSPYFVNNAESTDYFLIRMTSGLLILNMVLSPLYSIPESILIGMNSAHKTNLINIFSAIMLNVSMILLTYAGYGILGLSLSIIIATLVRGTFMYTLAKKNFAWFRLMRVEKKSVTEFFNFSIWVMGSAFATKLMLSSDILLIGIISSASTVTSYSMSIYAVQAFVNIIVLCVTSGLPGLGGIIGKGELEKARFIRSELLNYTWLAMSITGAMIILWNRDFVSLWIGQEHYIGSTENMILVISMAQLIFIRSEARIVDITLNIKRKVILGFASSGLSIIMAITLGNVIENSLVGILLGLILGRVLISFYYPIISRRILKVKSGTALSTLRQIFSLVLMYYFAYFISGQVHVETWVSLIAYSTLSFPFFFLLAFYLGFESDQRLLFLRRIGQIINKHPVAQSIV